MQMDKTMVKSKSGVSILKKDADNTKNPSLFQVSSRKLTETIEPKTWRAQTGFINKIQDQPKPLLNPSESSNNFNIRMNINQINLGPREEENAESPKRDLSTPNKGEKMITELRNEILEIKNKETLPRNRSNLDKIMKKLKDEILGISTNIKSNETKIQNLINNYTISPKEAAVDKEEGKHKDKKDYSVLVSNLHKKNNDLNKELAKIKEKVHIKTNTNIARIPMRTIAIEKLNTSSTKPISQFTIESKRDYNFQTEPNEQHEDSSRYYISTSPGPVKNETKFKENFKAGGNAVFQNFSKTLTEKLRVKDIIIAERDQNIKLLEEKNFSLKEIISELEDKINSNDLKRDVDFLSKENIKLKKILEDAERHSLQKQSELMTELENKDMSISEMKYEIEKLQNKQPKNDSTQIKTIYELKLKTLNKEVLRLEKIILTKDEEKTKQSEMFRDNEEKLKRELEKIEYANTKILNLKQKELADLQNELNNWKNMAKLTEEGNEERLNLVEENTKTKQLLGKAEKLIQELREREDLHSNLMQKQLAERTNLVEENSKIKQQLSEADRLIQSLKEQREKEASVLQDSIKKHLAEREILLKDNTEIKKELVEVQKDIQQTVYDSKTVFDKTVSKYTEEKNVLQNEIVKLKQKNNELVEELKNVKQTMDQDKSEREILFDNLNKQNIMEKASLQEENSKLKQKHGDLEDEIKKLIILNEKVNEENELIKSSFQAQIENQINKHKTELNSLNEENKQLQLRVLSNENDFQHNLSDSKTLLEKSIRQYEKEKLSLQEENAKTKQKCKQLENSLEDSTKLNNKLTTEAETLKLECQTLLDRLTIKNKETLSMKVENDKLKCKLVETETELNRMRSENENLSKYAQMHLDEKKIVQDENTQLLEENQKLRQQISKVEKETNLTSFQSKIHYDNEINKLLADKAALQEEMSKLAIQHKADITELKEEVAKLILQNEKEKVANQEEMSKLVLQYNADKAALQEEIAKLVEQKEKEKAADQVEMSNLVRMNQEEKGTLQEEISKLVVQNEKDKASFKEEITKLVLQHKADKAALREETSKVVLQNEKGNALSQEEMSKLVLLNEKEKSALQEEISKLVLQHEIEKSALQEEISKLVLQNKADKASFQEEISKLVLQNEKDKASFQEEIAKLFLQNETDKTALQEQTSKLVLQNEKDKAFFQEETSKHVLQNDKDKTSLQEEISKLVLQHDKDKTSLQEEMSKLVLSHKADKAFHQEEISKLVLQIEKEKSAFREETSKLVIQNEKEKTSLQEEISKLVLQNKEIDLELQSSKQIIKDLHLENDILNQNRDSDNHNTINLHLEEKISLQEANNKLKQHINEIEKMYDLARRQNDELLLANKINKCDVDDLVSEKMALIKECEDYKLINSHLMDKVEELKIKQTSTDSLKEFKYEIAEESDEDDQSQKPNESQSAIDSKRITLNLNSEQPKHQNEPEEKKLKFLDDSGRSSLGMSSFIQTDESKATERIEKYKKVVEKYKSSYELLHQQSLILKSEIKSLMKQLEDIRTFGGKIEHFEHFSDLIKKLVEGYRPKRKEMDEIVKKLKEHTGCCWSLMSSGNLNDSTTRNTSIEKKKTSLFGLFGGNKK